ncbi:MAG: FixH family protein [Alphaproteobacteria bacterium]
MKAEGWFANGIEGRHVLVALVVFFGVMFAANGLLVYYAVDTFSGGDRPDPYRSGLRYNETIDDSARQAALGWQTEVAYNDREGRLTLRFADKSEVPIVNLHLRGVLGRPATDREDQEIVFEHMADGVYVAGIELSLGSWVLIAIAHEGEGGDPVYRLKRRLYVADRS